MSKTRNICFTINNYTENEMDAMEKWSQVTYMVYGKEKGEEGTPHLQGYAELKTAIPFTTIKKKLPRAHLEPRRGTARQAADYCKKDGDYKEQGEISNQGKRTDLELIGDMVKEEKTLKEVAQEYPAAYMKYHRGIQALKAVLLEPRMEQPTVTVLYGKTGTGKSRTAREICKAAYVWGPEQGHWFDGYEGQRNVIMEEFRGQLPLGTMLRLLDRYDCKVQYKGGMIEFVATNIIITSPIHPRDWYMDVGHDKVDQLLRRITQIKCLDSVYNALCQETLLTQEEIHF